MSHVYCPECGFQNPEAASYCAKCGAMLVREATGEATETFSLEEEELLEALDELGEPGVALVVRAGGGRAGESFILDPGRTTIGRSPDCGIFLDDVTVSRRHAAIEQRGERWLIEDLGSLNGTFVNRQRVDSWFLSDGDELQIGKYRISFLQR